MPGLKIQFVHRYFWPDTAPVAAILRAICETLIDEGHQVSVLTSQPCYKPEVDVPKQPKRATVNSIEITRISLLKEKRGAKFRRALNMGVFQLITALRLLFGPKQDVIVALSFPPVVNGWLFSWVAKIRGSDFFYHIMDIHPESSLASGHVKEGVLYRLARKIDTATCRHATRTIVLSDDMASTIYARPGLQSFRNIRVIANFNIPDYEAEASSVPVEFQKKNGVFRLTFAGNLGNFQALPNLVQAAKLLANERHIEWLFLGEGAAKAKLIQQAGDCVGQTIRFLPHQPAAVADAVIRNSDLGIVSLSPGIIRLANPCKTSSYLSMGCPLLLVIEPESGLYQTCVKEKIGIACPPDQPQQLADAVLQASKASDELVAMRQRATDYAKRCLRREVLLDKWRLLSREYEDSRQLGRE